MKVIYHRKFDKQYIKLQPQQKNRFKEARNLLLDNQFHPLLNNHKLSGKYANHRSINITGDIRAIYTNQDDAIIFIAIGTHSELYK